MITLTNTKSVVGLDLEAGSVAATEVRANGSMRVSGAGILPLPAGLVREGEIADPDALAEALKQLFSENKLGKDVRLGVANQRVVVRTLRLPVIENREELEAAIRFQAQDEIPMPLDQAVLEFEVVGRIAGEGQEQAMEVVVVAARRDMVSSLVKTMRKAGLRPVGVDLSAFAMIRALVRDSGALDVVPAYEERAGHGGEQPPVAIPATLYCNLGDITNLAIARGGSCLFTRVSQFGIEGIAQRLAERRALTLEHARQWLVHVGLSDPVDTVEGDGENVVAAREALAEGATKLVDEIRLSLEFYGAQEGGAGVENVVACGAGVTIPGLLERIERELGLGVAAPCPQPLAHLDPESAARLTLPYGLSVES
jgi:type IV pilus assembly protein PilM